MNTKPTIWSRFATATAAAPRRSLAAVLLFIALAGIVGGPVAAALETEGGFTPADSDSAKALERIEEATGNQPSGGVLLLVDTPDGSQTGVEAATEKLSKIDGISEVAPGGLSRDGSSALVTGTLTADVPMAEVGHDVVEAFDDVDGVEVGGAAVTDLQLGEQVEKDLGRAELMALPILVLLSILIFGGRAAVLPLLVGTATVMGTFAVLLGITQVYGLSIFALNLVIGLGLGLAIDYTLFLLSRYREELDRQGATTGAVRTTMATAGRTVVYSAATVAVALATLTVFPMGFLRSMGIAGASVAVVAAVASLLIAPIVFGLWGAKLARRRPARRAAREAAQHGTAQHGTAQGGGSEGRWYRFSHAVMRRPGVIAVGTGAIMLLLAAPALRAEWTPVDGTVIPEGLSSRTVNDRLTTEYDAEAGTPVTAIVSDDAAKVATFAADASKLPGVLTSAEPDNLGDGTWQIELRIAGDPAGQEARSLVTDLRTIADDTDVDALVAGPAAEFADKQDAIADALPLALGLLGLLTMLVLWLMTGSVVLPIKAVVMNVLTVGVSLGVITWIYQDGRFTDLLGYTPNGGIEPGNFLVAAALVFALSTDYGVFLLGRIKEARDTGLSETEAVATGLGRTGSVVTAAAILLAVAIGAFSTSEISFMQQIGIAVAIGVLVDAFVVRSLLVPSLMAMMGKWNWWAPMWLRKIHDKVGLVEGDANLPAAPPTDGSESGRTDEDVRLVGDGR